MVIPPAAAVAGMEMEDVDEVTLAGEEEGCDCDAEFELVAAEDDIC